MSYKAPVFSMDLTGLAGSRPKPLIKERNVDADHYIQAYLQNEKKRTIPSEMRMRNPMFADYPYPSSRQQSSYSNLLHAKEDQRSTPYQQQLGVNKSQQIDRALHGGSQPAIQNQPTPNQEHQRQKYSEHSKATQLRQEELKNHSMVAPKQEDSLDKLTRQSQEQYSRGQDQGYQRSGSEQQLAKQSKVYTRHNILGSNYEVYKPKIEQSIRWNLYDRPQFSEYQMNSMPIPQIIQNKNRSALQKGEYVTANREYGIGTQFYTDKPIYPTSKPQNIDKE